MPTLYIVATPIGNLEDITLRALRILKESDFVLCEDTRVTDKLLKHYGIKTPMISYHQHSKIQKIDQISGLLKQGKNLALVSDAGTPGINDPGNKLIELILEEMSDISIEAIPGPSALTSAASISGFNMDRFLFMGFLPLKNKRKKIISEIIKCKYPVVFYESTHRIIKTLSELHELDSNLDIVVNRELTKKFETIYHGKILDVIERLKKSSVKGEFVVIIRNIH